MDDLALAHHGAVVGDGEGGAEVLVDGEVGEDAAALGDDGHAGPGDLVGGAAGEVPARDGGPGHA
jgi:hypothetical protein